MWPAFVFISPDSLLCRSTCLLQLQLQVFCGICLPTLNILKMYEIERFSLKMSLCVASPMYSLISSNFKSFCCGKAFPQHEAAPTMAHSGDGTFGMICLLFNWHHLTTTSAFTCLLYPLRDKQQMGLPMAFIV